MLILSAAFVAGGLAPFAPCETLTGFALIALLLVLSSRRLGWKVTSLLIVLALSGGLFGANALRARSAVAAYEGARDASFVPLPLPLRCSATGVVSGAPTAARGILRWDALLAVSDCEGTPRSWSGQVTLYGGPPDLARGDRVAVIAQLAPPQRLWNQATFDPRPSDARRGVLRSGSAIDVRRLEGREPWSGLLGAIDRARAKVRARIEATFPGDTGAMARALVLGETDLTAEDDLAFRTSGLSHLLAVSGMHLVLVVATLVAVVRALLLQVEGLAARIDVGRLAATAGVPFTWVYAEFAGASGSALRAAWMLTFALLARALGRRSDGPRALALSLVAMAVVDPLVIFDVSFQLSAAATAGLLAFARPLGATLSGALPAACSWASPVARVTGTTLAATLPCSAVLARFAPTLPLGGVLANLAAVPLGESAALPLCLVHALLAPWPAAERGAALTGGGALGLVRAIARVSSSLPALALAVPPPTGWQLVAIAVGAFAFAVHTGAPRLQRGAAALALLSVLLVLEGVAVNQGRPRHLLRATFLDVGQGDAALIDLPDGSAMVIDGGGLIGSPLDTGARVLAPTLRARRRRAIAVAVLSHPHPDHFGGLLTGLAGVRLGEAWDTGQGEREGVLGGYAAWLAAARDQAAPVRHPEELCGQRSVGGASVEVLAPCPSPSADRNPNDNSFVIKIGYGARSMLFVGDAEGAEESDLLKLGAETLRADVLKVGHHGSRTSSSPAFLSAVSPRAAVLSAGVRNRYGHPHESTLAAFRAAGIPLWRTDRDGAVTAETDGVSLRLTSLHVR